MRRLTLILSDLYLQDESMGGEVPHTHELPALSGLLRIASREHIGDWRRWLRSQVGGVLESGSAWRATPVALEARLDHVRMLDRGLLLLDSAERAAWCADFNRVFGPQYSLRDGGERAFILEGLKPLTAKLVDPARLLGAEIGPALPGAEAPELRRLWAEIEMWLHGAALNDERQRTGERRVSALWLWGRDADLGDAAESRVEAQARTYGDDPLLRFKRITPNSLADAESAPHVIAEFAALTGHARESLAELDTHWFAAARQALDSGALSELDIVANDQRFRISRSSRWRFWRRRRSWLEILAHPAREP